MKKSVYSTGSLADIIERQNNKKVDDGTVNGKCSKCGSCCTRILPMSDGELKNIKAYVLRNKIKPTHHTTDPNTLDLVCPCNTMDGCSIYPVRPAICKSYMCNKPEDKMFRDRDYFHSKFETHNMWQEVFMGFDHSLEPQMVDGRMVLGKSKDRFKKARDAE